MTNLEDQEDTALLHQVRDGDQEAFAVLVRRHCQGAYIVAYRFLGDREEAEDMVQSAFLKLWERPVMWSPELDSRFTTWFYRVVVNLCLDWRKKRRPLLVSEPIEAPAREIGQEERLLLTERQALLESQIDALPERQRTAINLCYSSGLSNKEAAQVMDVSLRALQSLLMRAKSSIRKNLRSMF